MPSSTPSAVSSTFTRAAIGDTLRRMACSVKGKGKREGEKKKEKETHSTRMLVKAQAFGVAQSENESDTCLRIIMCIC